MIEEERLLAQQGLFKILPRNVKPANRPPYLLGLGPYHGEPLFPPSSNRGHPEPFANLVTALLFTRLPSRPHLVSFPHNAAQGPYRVRSRRGCSRWLVSIVQFHFVSAIEGGTIGWVRMEARTPLSTYRG